MAGAKELLSYSKELRILYVEDDDKLREDTLRLLSTFFGRVSVAINGKEALELYDSNTFDMVISDYTMPEMDGLELTRKIKEINGEQIVIILSAHDEPQYVEDLREAGINDFIFKPLNIQQFIDTMYSNCKAIHDKKNTL